MSCLLVICALFGHEPQGPYGSAEVCGCAEARAADGRCAKCDVGYFAAVRIESERLFDVIDSHGHEVFAERMRCTACRPLIASGGYCDECHMGYVDGKGYFGRLGYHMAKGRRADSSSARRPCCPAGNAWCESCRCGWVGDRRFDDRSDFEPARAAMAVLLAAISTSATCEMCAMAMIGDSRCPACKVEYKDGKRIALSAAAAKDGG